jgi:hypothetical protein
LASIVWRRDFGWKVALKKYACDIESDLPKDCWFAWKILLVRAATAALFYIE